MDYKFCVHCGKKIASDAVFCRFCGAKQPVNNNQHQSTSSPSQQTINQDGNADNAERNSKEQRKLQQERSKFNARSEHEKNKINYRKQQYHLEQKMSKDKEYQQIEKYRTINIITIIACWILPWIPMFFDETLPTVAWVIFGAVVSLAGLGVSIYIFTRHQGFKKNSIVLMVFEILMTIIYLANL